MKPAKKARKKVPPQESSKQRIAKAEAESKKSRRLAATIAHKREQIVAARRKVADELEKLDEALRALDVRLPPTSWSGSAGKRTFFQKGSVAGTVVEILSVKDATRGEIRAELRRRYPDDEIKDTTLDTMLQRLKVRGFIEQKELRGPYHLAAPEEAQRERLQERAARAPRVREPKGVI